MTRPSGMPVGADVRERLRAAQRAEAEAVGAVQKALAAQTAARARLEGIMLKHRTELSKAAHNVQAAQAVVVRTSGLERAAALLNVSSNVLRSAVKETAEHTNQTTTGHTKEPRSSPTTALDDRKAGTEPEEGAQVGTLGSDECPAAAFGVSRPKAPSSA